MKRSQAWPRVATDKRVSPQFDWRCPHHWLAYGFGSGLAPAAPGTFGTIAAIPLYLLLAPLPTIWYLIVLVPLFLIGIWACDKAAVELSVQDPSAIVWDEILGYLITMIAAPAGWLWILVGFALFRLFDIWKPWPIRVLDRRVHGGLGVMLDDVAAGIMACALLHVLAWLVV